MCRLVRSRTGAIDVTLVVRLLGIVAVMGLIIASGVTFFGPQISNLASIFGFEDSGSNKAINSARGLALATSCTAIMNAHAPGSDAYMNQWTRPFNLQGFSSGIQYSCEDAVPKENETLSEQGVWFAPPEEGGVHVTCDSYDTTDDGYCEVRNFALPQDIGYVQDELPNAFGRTEEAQAIASDSSAIEAGGELMSGDLSGAVNAVTLGAAQNYIRGFGMPKYVLYYQSIPTQAEQFWMKRGQGVSAMAIGIGLAVEVASLGLAPGGAARRIFGKVGRTVMNSRVVRAAGSAAGTAGTSVRRQLSRIPGATRVSSGAYRIQGTVYRAADVIRKVGEAASTTLRRIRNLPSVARARMQKRMPFIGIDTLSYVGMKLAGTNRQIVDFLIRGSGDDMMADISASYAARMSRRLADEGMAGLTKAGDGGLGATQGVGRIAVRGDISDEVWQRQYADMAAQSLRDSIREVGDAYYRRGDIPIDGDALLRHFDEAGGRSIDDFATDQAQMLTTNREITTWYLRNLDEAGTAGLRDVVDELPADAATAYALRTRFTLKGVAQDFLQSSDSTLDEFIPPEFRETVSESIGRWSSKASDLCSAGRINTNTGCRQLFKSVALLPCNSPAARQAVMDRVWSNMNAQDKAFWKSAGECTQYSATSPLSAASFCGASAGPTVTGTSSTLATGQAMCGYMTFMGYMADYKVAQTMHRTPAKVNSMYLQSALGPALEIPLHPIANWYFVGLIRGGGNPNSRFVMASPFTLEEMAGATDPHLEVRPGSMSYKMTSANPAKATAPGEGLPDPGPTNQGAVCDIAGAMADVMGNAFDAIAGFADTIHRLSMGVVPNAAGMLQCRADIDGNPNDTEVVVGNGEEMTVEQAITCGKKGTFLLTNDRCDDELMYVDTPQVRRVPGPNYSINPGSVSTWEPPAVGLTLYEQRDQVGGENATVLLSNVDLTEINWNKSNSQRQDGPFTARSFNVTPAAECSRVEVRYCTESVGSVWSDLAACSENEYTIDDMSQTHKFTIGGSAEVYSAGIRCQTDEGASSTTSMPRNVQQIKKPGPGERYGRTVGLNYFQQLWYWNNDPDTSTCEDDGNCRFNWIRNWNAEQPLSGEVSGDGDASMAGMYPIIYSDGYGQTEYEDPDAVNQLWSTVTSLAKIQEATKSKAMRAIQISTEGTATHSMWITRDGDAIYGYNADINAVAWARAGMLTVALAIGILSGGTLAFVVGVAEVILTEVVGVTTAWPNH